MCCQTEPECLSLREKSRDEDSEIRKTTGFPQLNLIDCERVLFLHYYFRGERRMKMPVLMKGIEVSRLEANAVR